MSPSSSAQKKAPQSDVPTFAHYAAEDFVQGAGVAIFHIASARVVVCNAVDRRVGKYYFLPKGRRDAGEDTRTGAEREGFEEVCINPKTSTLYNMIPVYHEHQLTPTSPATATASSPSRRSTTNPKRTLALPHPP